MARYKATAPQALLAKIKAKDTIINRSASLALNKTATFTVQQSVSAITQMVNLEPSYVKRHLRVSGRASPAKLSTTIQANERASLLTRYPNMISGKGIRVAVNKGSGFRQLRSAFRVTGLRGSDATGIALRNKDAVAYFEKSAGQGLKTTAKTSKLAKLRAKAASKPRGIHVLHGRSINQLFTSVRGDIKDKIDAFLLEDFVTQLNRLKR